MKTQSDDKSSVRRKAPDASGYNFVANMTMNRRYAHFVDWGAKAYPYHWWQINIIYKAITGQSQTPRLDNASVQILRKNSAAVRRVLRADYQRDLICRRGLGVRATVNSEDATETAMPSAIWRFDSARKNVIAVNDLIDPVEVKNKLLKDYLTKSIRDVIKTISAPDFIGKLEALPEMKEKAK